MLRCNAFGEAGVAFPDAFFFFFFDDAFLCQKIPGEMVGGVSERRGFGQLPLAQAEKDCPVAGGEVERKGRAGLKRRAGLQVRFQHRWSTKQKRPF